MPPHKLGRATRRVSRLKPRSFTLVYKLTPKLFFVLFTLPTVHPALPNVMVPKQSLDTSRPVLPSVAYSTEFSFLVSPKFLGQEGVDGSWVSGKASAKHP